MTLPFNIWLPLPDAVASVECLATAHLAVQRYQVLELVEHLHGIPEADSVLPDDYVRTSLDDHPVVGMWVGHTLFLAEIGLMCSDRWKTHLQVSDWIYPALANFQEMDAIEDAEFGPPCWFGDVDVHLSHQAALLGENLGHYSQFFNPLIQQHLVYPKSAYA